MDKETKHLFHWWFEWLYRLFVTTYHIFNRKAYHKWKDRKIRRQQMTEPDPVDIQNFGF